MTNYCARKFHRSDVATKSKHFQRDVVLNIRRAILNSVELFSIFVLSFGQILQLFNSFRRFLADQRYYTQDREEERYNLNFQSLLQLKVLSFFPLSFSIKLPGSQIQLSARTVAQSSISLEINITRLQFHTNNPSSKFH